MSVYPENQRPRRATMAMRLAGAAFALVATLWTLLPSPALANPNLIQDGNFSQFTGTYSPPTTYGAQITNSNLPSWQWVNVATPSNADPATGNYAFILDGSSIAGGASVYKQSGTTQPGTNININGGGTLGLWGPGEANGSLIPRAPTGSSHVLAMDGAYQPGYVFQTVPLITGATYTVSFYMSAGQQVGYTFSGTASCGTNCSANDFKVGLGNCGIAGAANQGCTATNSKITTAITMLNGQGWLGSSSTQWALETVTLVAQAGATALWLLADASAPTSQPPFALLSDVSMVLVVPEPPAYAVLALAMLALFGFRRYRRKTG